MHDLPTLVLEVLSYLGMSHVQSHPCGCRGDRFEHGAPFSSPGSKQTGLQFALNGLQ